MTRTTRLTVLGALLIAVFLIGTTKLGRLPGAGPAGTHLLEPLPTPEPLVPTALPAFRPTATPRPANSAPAPTISQNAATLTPGSAETRLPEPAVVEVAMPGVTGPAMTLEPQETTNTAVETVAHPTETPAFGNSGPGASGNGPASTLTPMTGEWPHRVTSDRQRAGVGVPIGAITDYDWGDGLPGWYLVWRVDPAPAEPEGTRFVQLVVTRHDHAVAKPAAIVAAAKAQAGSLWLIGNEPDVAWQGNATPEEYAAAYREWYRKIKELDPTAQVAIAGVSQPTPLRLAYLDRILAAHRDMYGEEMPVDVWNVHAFILREEADSWGVGIPPGMEDAAAMGKLFEIGDHADMEIFKAQIVDFRKWMAEHGLRDKPLIVSEYGVLMPESYGFPPEVVSQFMIDTFDYFLTARDETTGYPADDDRLVQAFLWYSAADTKTRFPTSNLYDPETTVTTQLGEVFRAYVGGLR